MYYEAREHQSLPVASAAEAVNRIHSGHIQSNQCPVFRNSKGERIALVADGHIDNMWLEVAVINPDTKEQIESITFGWIKTEALKLAVVNAAVIRNEVFRRNVTLSIDGSCREEKVSFECGCCGASFQSTIKEQKQFDQDAGYGICPECALKQ
jgi:hypothetical protein